MWICFYLFLLLCCWSECEPRDLTLQSHWPAQCFREGQPAAHASHLGSEHSLVVAQKSSVHWLSALAFYFTLAFCFVLLIDNVKVHIAASYSQDLIQAKF